MAEPRVTLLDLVNLQNDLRQRYYRESGLAEGSDILEGLASGFDACLTIMEVSRGAFQGMSREAASEIMDYFLQESYAHKGRNPEVAIWYLSWAKTLESFFLK